MSDSIPEPVRRLLEAGSGSMTSASRLVVRIKDRDTAGLKIPADELLFERRDPVKQHIDVVERVLQAGLNAELYVPRVALDQQVLRRSEQFELGALLSEVRDQLAGGSLEVCIGHERTLAAAVNT